MTPRAKTIMSLSICEPEDFEQEGFSEAELRAQKEAFRDAEYERLREERAGGFEA